MMQIPFFNRGRSYFSMKKFALAEKDFSEAIKRNPGLGRAYYFRSLIMYQQGNYQKSIDDCSTAIFLGIDTPTLYFYRGHSYSKLKQYETALNDYKSVQSYYRSVSEIPFPGFAFLVAFAYEKNREYEKAIEYYSKYLEEKPNGCNAYNNRGWVYLLTKRYTKAETDFTRAIECNPEHDRAYFNRGSARIMLKDFTGAVADYQKEIKIHPKLSNAYYKLGYSYERLGKTDEAIQNYKTSLSLNDDHKKARSRLDKLMQ